MISATLFWSICCACGAACSWVSESSLLFNLSVCSLVAFQLMQDRQDVDLSSPGHYVHFGLISCSLAALWFSIDLSKSVAKMLHTAAGSFALLSIGYAVSHPMPAASFKAEALHECLEIDWRSSVAEVPFHCSLAGLAAYPLVSLLVLPRDASAKWFWLSSAALAVVVVAFSAERKQAQRSLLYTVSAAVPLLGLVGFVKKRRKGGKQNEGSSMKGEAELEASEEPEEEQSGEQEAVSSREVKLSMLGEAVAKHKAVTERLRVEAFQLQQQIFQLEARSYGEADPEQKKQIAEHLDELKAKSKERQDVLEESVAALEKSQAALATFNQETKSGEDLTQQSDSSLET